MNKLSLIAIFCVSISLLAGGSLSLQSMQEGDFGADKVVDRVSDTILLKAERQPVSMSWAINGEIELSPKPAIAESKAFRMVVDAAAFNEGITLGLTWPGALIHINPMPGSLSRVDAISPMDMVLVNEGGRAFSAGSGMEPLLNGNETDGSNPFPVGTSAFRVGANVGTGLVNLFADNLNYDSGATYVINVIEKDSDLVLGIQTGNDTYLEGQSMSVNAFVHNSRSSLSAEGLEGLVISPGGQTYPLTFNLDRQTASFPIRAAASGQSGLWQVQVTAFVLHDGIVIRRDAKTAFAVVNPTARFSGTAMVDQGLKGLTAGLEVEIGVAGRYEVRGILMGTDRNGQMVPLAVGHSANWLVPGTGRLTLSFDSNLIRESGLTAPYQINDLRLIHQDRMSLIARQTYGLQIN